MGRKISADEGPVHRPIGRRHAMKQKRGPNKKHNRTNKKQNKQKAANKNQNKGNIACDRGPFVAHRKRKWLALTKIGMARATKQQGKSEPPQNRLAIQDL